MKLKSIIYFCIIIICALQSCSTTKFVPDNEYLLRSAAIKIDTKELSTFDLNPYIKQKANYKTFQLAKLPLFIYDLAGRDTSNWLNKGLKNGGEPPVIYDSSMVNKSVVELRRILTNKGYIHAQINPEVKIGKKVVDVEYKIKAGDPYRIADYSINIADSIFEKGYKINRRAFLQKKDTTSLTTMDELLLQKTLVKKNTVFDLDVLNEERNRVTSVFRKIGYYSLSKDYVGFVADTTAGKDRVNLQMVMYPFIQKAGNGERTEVPHHQYVVGKVIFYVDYNPLTDGDLAEYQPTDTVSKNNCIIYYGKKGRYIRPQILFNSCYIRPGSLFNENMTNTTYQSLYQLRILKNVNIKFEKYSENDSIKLCSVITCLPDKKQAISTEIEGTNSAGFLGFGGSVGYTHRNIFGGSELLNVKITGSYEALTSNFSKFSNNYFEMGGEASLTFPRFIFPFLSDREKKKLHASTQVTSSYSFERRPGYFTRTVLSSGFKYIWQNGHNSLSRHTFDLIDISYVNIPSLDSTFSSTLTDNARIYSFTDQFIMSMGYTYSKGNYATTSTKKLRSLYSIKGSVETAGNTLSLIASLANIPKDANGSRKIFNTYFAQYAKANFDYSRMIPVDKNNAIAWRIGGGVAYPYGNNKLVPFQKRFFSGGANSVRGWAVRELGPGSYYNPKANFYTQSGDIRFDANIEYRSHVFWNFDFAAFLDAGNVWTVHEYEGQEGGVFKINKFYKQIATAWGLGLRLNLNFLIIRLDCGWKLYNPADIPIYDTAGVAIPGQYKSKWNVLQPFDFRDNMAWHIAIGYPF